MDEPTSALDNENFLDIEKKLLSLKNIALVNICHRHMDEVTNQYDKVIIMRNGKVEIINNSENHNELNAIPSPMFTTDGVLAE